MKTLTYNKIQSIIDFTKTTKRTAILISIVVLISAIASSSISIFLSNENNLTIPSKGNLKTIGVEVYWDANGNNKIETINWSDVWIGIPKNVTIYIQSISNYEIKLELKTSEYTPEIIANHTTVSWDYNRATIKPNEMVKIKLTLTINKSFSLVNHSSIEKNQNFDVDIQIIAS